MTKKTKVIGIVCGTCAILGVAVLYAYENIQNYIYNVKGKSWGKGYDVGMRNGERIGRHGALVDAFSKGYITNDQFNEIMGIK